MTPVEQVKALSVIEANEAKMVKLNTMINRANSHELRTLIQNQVDKLLDSSYYIYTGILLARINQNQSLKLFRSHNHGR